MKSVSEPFFALMARFLQSPFFAQFSTFLGAKKSPHCIILVEFQSPNYAIGEKNQDLKFSICLPPSYPVFIDSPEGSPPHSLYFQIMRFVPQVLEKLVVFRRKVVAFQSVIQTLEIINVKEGDALGSNNVLVLVQGFVVGQRKHEFRQFFVVSLFHEHVANAGDLVRRENESLRTLPSLV